MIAFRHLAGLFALGTGLSAGPEAAPPRKLEPVVGRASSFVVSKAVRDLPVLATPRMDATADPRLIHNPSLAGRSFKSPIKRTARASGAPDAARYAPAHAPAAMPAPLLSFEGLDNADNLALLGGYVAPPDINGDVGPRHYVQAVNLAAQVFDRRGLPLSAPFLLSQLFISAGGPCATTDHGDPIVLYDPLADRWLLSQFALPFFPFPPYYQCVAVSQTGDPAGAYYAYTFEMPGENLNDYPKFGVWPDAYYMTDNQFDRLLQFAGGGVFAFDRARLLAGDPAAAFIYFDLAQLDPTIGGMLPSDLDGPPRDRPNLFAYFTADEYGDALGDGLRLFEFRPDFQAPSLSTFTELPFLPVAAFDPVTPFGRGHVPQPGTNRRLDSLGDRLMHRLQYRRFATHESLAASHTVDVSGAAGADTYLAGVRYYELRRRLPDGAWEVHEQATYAPADGVHRFLPSAALDNDGNLAVGFSVSDGTATFPGIRYAGRLAADPAGGLFQGEGVLQAGSLTQEFYERWGDYSMMSVDPADDCTFWFTSEYYSAVNPGCEPGLENLCWRTRIGTFRFPTCTPPEPSGSLVGRVLDASTSDPIAGALVTATGEYVAVSDGSGNYAMSVPPGTYALSAMKAGYAGTGIVGQVVTPGAATAVDLALDPLALLAREADAIDDRAGNANGNVDPDECVALEVTLRNEGTAGATAIEAALATSTPEVAVTTGVAPYADLPPDAAGTNLTPLRFQTGPSFLPGTPIDFTLRAHTAQGSFAMPFRVRSGTMNPTEAPPFNAAGPRPILDGGATEMAIHVSGLAAPIARVRAAVRITHTQDGDLRLSLIGPDGTAVVLSDRRGGAGDNFGTDCPADDGDDTVFDDGAFVPIGAAEPPFAGIFRPEQPLSAFDGKHGAAANGTWRLRVEDTHLGRVGTLECAALLINEYLLIGGGGGCGPHLSVGDALAAGEGGASARFVVTLSPAQPGPVTVQYATSDAGATAGADYSPASGTLSFGPGETGHEVLVPILGDSLDEIDEAFHLNLAGAAGATVGGRGVGTIPDDDPEPTLSVSDASHPEGDAGTAPFEFEVTLSAPSGKIVSTQFATGTRTATTPSDFQAAAGRLTFSPGETARPVAVNVVGDTVDEPPETFRLDLLGAVNASAAGASGTGTIVDDDVSGYYAVTPCRLLDTRLTPPALSANTTRELALGSGPCGIPPGAGALVVNVAVVNPTAAGNLRVYPAGQPEPLASAINFTAGRTRANNALVLLGPEGRVWVKCDMPPGSGGTAHLVVDLYGYFE
jgi:hypothetical protein